MLVCASISRRLLGSIVVLLAMASAAAAQESTLRGTLTDSSSAALPGVVVRAVNAETGNSFEAITDVRGAYRIPVRVGRYTVSAELPGFTSGERKVTLLLGQEADVSFQLSLGGLTETLTVTAERPFVETAQSSINGHIDPEQAQALPLNGRNWMELVLIAPGARGNAIDNRATAAPTTTGGTQGNGDFEINLDGQQITQLLSVAAGAGPPRFSRDAIGEVELKSGRFDATQGRALGLQVNVVTSSGANQFMGSTSGYFRHDTLERRRSGGRTRAAVSGSAVRRAPSAARCAATGCTSSSPMKGERNPQTAVYSTPYPAFNGDLSTTNLTHMCAGARRRRVLARPRV